MSQRNLRSAFRPESVAVVGASERAGSVGRVVLESILAGGFAGPVYAVNPKYGDVLGVPCYHRLADLPTVPDLAVIVTPAQTVPGLVAELGEAGGRAAVVLSAGLTIANGLREAMLSATGRHLVRIIGPNTIGLISPSQKLNASFAGALPRAGKLALVSQSGAMVSSLIDWAVAEGIGFSQVVSLGDMADVDVGDCLDYFAMDSETTGILLYLESVPAPRKFMSAARAASRIKPVIALKPGRHAAAQKAALTHTGALAGADRVIEAAFRRAGIVRVDDLEDLLEAAEVTARYRPLQSARVGIVTNGGGAGVLAVDHLLDHGCSIATLVPATIDALDAALPSAWSHANPVDIIGDATPERFATAVRTVAADPGVDALLVMDCPTALASPMDAAAAVAAITSGGLIGGKPVLTCWLGKRKAEPARSVLQDAGIGTFDTPAQAARAIAMLSRWATARNALQRIPSAHQGVVVDRASAQAILAGASAEGRALLTEPEAKSVLAAYGIRVPPTMVARDEDEVEGLAAQLLSEHPAVVVKLLSRSISHKSDIGGVVLDISSAAAARAAAAAIRGKVEAAGGGLDGFSVQPMIDRGDARELITGVNSDPLFGPVVVFGTGGTSVEVVRDTSTELVPLDDVLAANLIDRTRVSRLLSGYRGVPPADREQIVAALVALSQLAIDFPEIVSVDINPLLADAAGVIALDARIQVDPRRSALAAPNPDLAIRPYPAAATSEESLDGLALTLRAIRPEDAALYPDFLARMDREDLRLRFLAPVATISDELLIRLTQIDYDREMAFVAIERGSGSLCGIVRYAADPDRVRAEFGVLVRSDLKGRGLGTLLMKTLIAYARSEGIGRLEGVVLRENSRMLQLGRDLGFVAEDGADGSTVRAVLCLTTPADG